MNQNKKYFTISEVSYILNLPSYKLRYLEKKLSDHKILKIRSRRYYNEKNIDELRQLVTQNITTNNQSNLVANIILIAKINDLISKFENMVKILSN